MPIGSNLEQRETIYMFNFLRVIEVQISPTVSIGTHLKRLRTLTSAFCPESCARQVIIFFDIADEIQSNYHFKRTSELALKTSYLVERDAYRFLLSWIVGGEYKVSKPGYKIAMFNDNHILGRFIAHWNDYNTKINESFEDSTEEQKLMHKQFKKLIGLLLTDAHEIRKKIERCEYGANTTLRRTLNTVLDNVILSRSLSVPVVYDAMHLDNYRMLLLEHLDNELLKLAEQLAHYPPESAASKGITAKMNSYSQALNTLNEKNELTLI